MWLQQHGSQRTAAPAVLTSMQNPMDALDLTSGAAPSLCHVWSQNAPRHESWKDHIPQEHPNRKVQYPLSFANSKIRPNGPHSWNLISSVCSLQLGTVLRGISAVTSLASQRPWPAFWGTAGASLATGHTVLSGNAAQEQHLRTALPGLLRLSRSAE